MFIVLQSAWQLALVFAGVVAFGWLTWHRLDRAVTAVLFLTPLYLLKIGSLPLTVLELLILISTAVWLIKKSKERAWPAVLKKTKPCWLPVGLILVGVGVATLFSADIKVSAGIFKSWFLEPMIFGVILLDVIKTKRQFKNLWLALVFSGAAVAAVSLGYLVAGKLTFDGRLAAFYLSPNQLAMFLAPALIIAIGFCFKNTSRLLKFLLHTSYFVLLVSLYFTFSYAAWLAIFVALVFLAVCLWQRQIINHKKFLVFSLLVLVFSLAVFSFQWGGQKADNLLNSDRSSWQSRLIIWRASGQILAGHWLVGIGPGLFQKYYLDYQKYFPPYLEWAVPQPQNIFLAFWLQTGLIGLAGFIWLLINFFKSIVDRFQKVKQPLVFALAAVIVYILAHGLLDTTYWKNDLALVFWAVIFLGYTTVRRHDW